MAEKTFPRQPNIEYQRIEINRVVEEATAMIAHQLGIHNIKIEKQLEPNLPQIVGNANQITQVLLNLIDFGMNIQEAGEMPRFRHLGGGSVAFESGVDIDVLQGLIRKGHRPVTRMGAYGGYQAILIDPETGVLMGGSDPRKDGCAIGY